MNGPADGEWRLDPSLEQIERYSVLEEVGRGGMAVVYRGRDRSLDREVAIKVLHAHLADVPESRARFQQEARAVARLRHRNIIEIYDYAGSKAGEGPSYIVTEFIEGETLKAFMDEHDVFFPDVAALIAIEICEAIGHAHSIGIIHRDLKQENIMINRSGLLKLMDFGIAKVIDQQQQMTMTGSILGSPAHMAPEMLEGKELDTRSDLFSLGTILYWLATGQLPFAGKNPHQVLRRIMEGDYPDPQQINPEVGAGLARIIKRCLENRPEDRFASAEELRRALEDDLADLELEAPQAELKRFFVSPEKYLDDLRPRVAAKLLDRGRAHLRAKKHRQALEALDRLLALEPGHPEALALVSNIERRKRWLRRLGTTAACLVVMLAAAAATRAAIHLWPHDDDPSTEGLDAGLAAVGPLPTRDETPLAEEPKAPQPDAGLADAGARPRADRRRVAVVRPPIVRRGDPRRVGPISRLPADLPVEHEVKITIEPYFSRLLIDGKEVAKPEESNEYGIKFRKSLQVGKHRVTIENENCQTDEFEVLVPAELRSGNDLVFRRQLRFKPASLVIESEIADASVYVNGKFKGTAAESKKKPITIPIEGKTGRVQVRLSIAHPEAGELRKTVFFEAGKQKIHTAKRDDFKPRSRGQRVDP